MPPLRLAFLRGFVFGLAGMLWFSARAPAQDFVVRIPGPADVLASIEDLDGDGVRELVVGDPGFSAHGAVRIHSGAGGGLLEEIMGAEFGARFGAALAIADADRDGVDDLIVGAPLADAAGVDSGAVLVFSGVDRQLIRSFAGEQAFDHFGTSVAALSTPTETSILVGAPLSDPSPALVDAGAAFVFDGMTGALLRSWDGLEAGSRFGDVVATLGETRFGKFVIAAPLELRLPFFEGVTHAFNAFTGAEDYFILGVIGVDQSQLRLVKIADLDGDGFSDLVVSTPDRFTPSVEVYSGATGALLLALSGDGIPEFGLGVADAGDLNGDQVGDLLIGSPNELHELSEGTLHLVSGATGNVLHRLRLPATTSLGRSTTGPGDLDGDGLAEFAVTLEEGGAPFLEVRSSREFFLFTSGLIAKEGQPFSLITSESDRGAPTLTAVIALGGVPLFLPILGIGHFTGDGTRVLSGTVPQGFAGLGADFIALAFSRIDSRLKITTVEHVEFR